MTKLELQAELEKRERQLKNADPDQVSFIEDKIAKIKEQIVDLEAKEAASADIKKEQPKPKVKKEKTAKAKKVKKEKKGKGVKALLPDAPEVKPLDPDCDELIAQHKEAAKKKLQADRKRAAKPESTKIVESVEKVAESVENKVEKLEKEGKGLSKDAADKLEIYTTQFIKSIEDAIKEEKNRKDFIKGLIEKLQKML